MTPTGYKPALSKSAVRPDDKYAVVNTVSKVTVESSLTPEKALRAAVSCNEHEARNDRPATYIAVDRDGKEIQAPRTTHSGPTF